VGQEKRVSTAKGAGPLTGGKQTEVRKTQWQSKLKRHKKKRPGAGATTGWGGSACPKRKKGCKWGKDRVRGGKKENVRIWVKANCQAGALKGKWKGNCCGKDKKYPLGRACLIETAASHV